MQGLALINLLGPAKSEGPLQVKERGKGESKILEDARLLALGCGGRSQMRNDDALMELGR